MKKEGGQSIQEIEKQFGLDKYEKTEYVKQIIKECLKHCKKLQKIAFYEDLKKQNKPLNAEMLDLLTKKDSLSVRVDALKQALDIYAKVPLRPGEQAPQKDNKAEILEKVKEFSDMAAKKLGYFFTVAATLAEKEKINPNPLASIPVHQQGAFVKAYKDMIKIQEEKDTTLTEEALRSTKLIASLLGAGDENIEGLKSVVESVIADAQVNSTHFKLTVPKIPQIENAYSASPVISVGKGAQQEVVKKEAPAPAPQPVPAPVPAPVVFQEKPVEVKEAPKPKVEPVQEVKKEEVKKSWDEFEEEDYDEYETVPEQKPVAQEESPKAEEEASPKREEKEDEFQVYKSKGDERKERLEEEKRRLEAKRYGRAGGRYGYYPQRPRRARRGGYYGRGGRGTYSGQYNE